MKRLDFIPRPDWPQKMEALGFSFHSIDGIYWDERAAYLLTSDEVDMLESVTNELHAMCIAAAQKVIDEDRYDQFAIPREFVPLIETSWNEDAPSLFGRFDFSWDGMGPPKLLEYNADTPTALLEASVAQWYWLQEVRPHADQFNSLHEKLIARWQKIAVALPNKTVYFSCVADSEEDLGNLEYMRDVAIQAGIETRFIDVGTIGWDAVRKIFVDEGNNPIQTLFKLYPWEWMVREAFGRNLLTANIRVIEPAWKMLISNKAILPVLWEMYPDHPNLLAAYFSPQKFASDFVKKPLLSREGANISIQTSGSTLSTPGEYGSEGFIYQAYHAVPNFARNGVDNFMCVGSWTVDGEAAGIGIREDESPITKNTSRFIPHFFE